MSARDPQWLTQDELKRRFHYDPETGVFIRRIRIANMLPGAVAGCPTRRGYLTIGICGRLFNAHRLAFLYMLGRWPSADVDHINYEPADNRWTNLREATRAQNCQNKRVRRDSGTGVKGVHQCKDRFHAAIWHPTLKKKIYLGSFPTAEQAHTVYHVKAKELFGEFARSA